MYRSDALYSRDHLSQSGPPPGTIINYKNPPNTATACQIVSILTFAIAFVLVLVRVGIKAFVVRKFGWDDYTAVLAMLSAAARVICMALAVSPWGFGRHVWDVPPQNIKMLWRLKAIGDTMYPPAMMCAKVSILLFYLQIFRIKMWFRHSCWALITFVICYLSAIFFVYLFYCKPEAATWNYTLGGKCVDGWSVDIATGALNIVTDLIILLIPLPILWDLQLSFQRKLGISLVFLVGVFTIVASVAREIAVASLGHGATYDASWFAVPEVLWLTLEMNISIICGSLLILPRIFPHVVRTASWGRFSGRWLLSSAVREKWRSRTANSSGNKYRPKRRDQFHKQGSDITLELGELGTGRTETVVEVPSTKGEIEDWEGDTVDEGVIKETRTYTVA